MLKKQYWNFINERWTEKWENSCSIFFFPLPSAGSGCRSFQNILLQSFSLEDRCPEGGRVGHGYHNGAQWSLVIFISSLRETLPRTCPFLTPSLVIQWGFILSSGVSVQTQPKGCFHVWGKLTSHRPSGPWLQSHLLPILILLPQLSLLPQSPISVNGTPICPRAQPKTSESSLILLPTPPTCNPSASPSGPTFKTEPAPCTPLPLQYPHHLPLGQLVYLIPILSLGPFPTASRVSFWKHKADIIHLLRKCQWLSNALGVESEPSCMAQQALPEPPLLMGLPSSQPSLSCLQGCEHGEEGLVRPESPS